MGQRLWQDIEAYIESDNTEYGGAGKPITPKEAKEAAKESRKVPTAPANNNKTLTITKDEYTNDFRRIQEESSKLSTEQLQLNHKQSISDENRRRIGRVLKGFLESRSNGTSNDFGISLKSEKYGTTFNFAQVNGSLFHDIFEVNRNYLQNGELVDLHDNYDNCKCYLSEDGLCGFAIEEDGNLVSVFSLNPSDRKGFLYAIKDFIREQGATHLDAFASKSQNLEEIYKKTLGFQTAATMDYNMEYDHDDIAANHNSPNVVFMVASDTPVESKHFNGEQYDEAVAHQKSQIQHFHTSHIGGWAVRGEKQLRISTEGYRKGEPQKHPDTAYVFTENAQAAGKLYKDNLGYDEQVEAENPIVLKRDEKCKGTHLCHAMRWRFVGYPAIA